MAVRFPVPSPWKNRLDPMTAEMQERKERDSNCNKEEAEGV